MPCSCCNTSSKKGRVNCPACDQIALSVNKQTMLHQLQFPDNQAIAKGDYAYCENSDCHVGYFSGSNIAPRNKLRAFHENQSAMLCYCFDISKLNYRKALLDGSAEAMKAFVVRQTKESLCACESRNPSGRCCLAAFKRMEQDHDC